MENEYYKEIPRNKGTASIVVIVILSILLVGALGYIGYDKLIKTEEPKEEEKTEPKEEKLEDVTNESYVAELNDMFVAKDNSFSIYTEDALKNGKLTLEDTKNNKTFIALNILNYMKENNMNLEDIYKTGEICQYIDELPLNCNTISKDTINKYIQEKYNTKISYDFAAKDTVVDFGGVIYTYNNEYAISSSLPRSGCDRYFGQKLIKAEKQGDNLYIYDKALECAFDGGTSCYELGKETLDTENTVYYVDYGQGYGSAKDSAEYVINNLSDKLNTYKHTFKKAKNGNYYWVSTERN